MGKCQMPNCDNEGNLIRKKNGVFCGIHLDNISIICCENHSEDEINLQLNTIGNRESSSQQKNCNTFMEARKVLYRIS